MRVRFQHVCFDGERRELTRDDQPLHLTPKAFDLLGHLLGRRPNAISQSDLFDLLWPESLVDSSRIHQLIQEIRTALGDHERHVIRIAYALYVRYSVCS
jgi:DNA-binding winged helix-turn-helix (wHTH) protein